MKTLAHDTLPKQTKVFLGGRERERERVTDKKNIHSENLPGREIGDDMNDLCEFRKQFKKQCFSLPLVQSKNNFYGNAHLLLST